MGRRRGGEVEVHAVLHRLGFRDGKDVDADGDGAGIGEAHGFDVGHAGFLAGNTPAERLRPEPADRGVIPGIHRDLNKPQRHAANPMLSWLNVMNWSEGAIHHSRGRRPRRNWLIDDRQIDPRRTAPVVLSDLARVPGCYAFARHAHLAPPIDRDHRRSGALPRAPGTIVGVQLGEAVTVAQCCAAAPGTSATRSHDRQPATRPGLPLDLGYGLKPWLVVSNNARALERTMAANYAKPVGNRAPKTRSCSPGRPVTSGTHR